MWMIFKTFIWLCVSVEPVTVVFVMHILRDPLIKETSEVIFTVTTYIPCFHVVILYTQKAVLTRCQHKIKTEVYNSLDAVTPYLHHAGVLVLCPIKIAVIASTRLQISVSILCFHDLSLLGINHHVIIIEKMTLSKYT